jgi:hypothetical protein
MNRLIVITASFTATHCWPECPIEEVKYLRNEHRHTFHVTMKWPVLHDDRDREFIVTKNMVNDHLHTDYENRNLGRMSCEMIAEKLMDQFFACFVSVFEDAENGAEVFL